MVIEEYDQYLEVLDADPHKCMYVRLLYGFTAILRASIVFAINIELQSYPGETVGHENCLVQLVYQAFAGVYAICSSSTQQQRT